MWLDTFYDAIFNCKCIMLELIKIYIFEISFWFVFVSFSFFFVFLSHIQQEFQNQIRKPECRNTLPIFGYKMRLRLLKTWVSPFDFDQFRIVRARVRLGLESGGIWTKDKWETKVFNWQRNHCELQNHPLEIWLFFLSPKYGYIWWV